MIRRLRGLWSLALLLAAGRRAALGAGLDDREPAAPVVLDHIR